MDEGLEDWIVLRLITLLMGYSYMYVYFICIS